MPITKTSPEVPIYWMNSLQFGQFGQDSVVNHKSKIEYILNRFGLKQKL